VGQPHKGKNTNSQSLPPSVSISCIIHNMNLAYGAGVAEEP
jgi:hypothetical protein